MILIPGGDFAFGCDAKKKGIHCADRLRRETIGDFFIDRTEVSVAAYRTCVAAGRCTQPAIGELCKPGLINWEPRWNDHPVNCITPAQAETYCRSRGMHLPTRLQFQKAARGGKDERDYPWGAERPDCQRAVMVGVSSHGRRGPGCGTGRTWRVGSRPKGASPYGVLDMSGNVAEFTIVDGTGSGFNVDGPIEDLARTTRVDGGDFNDADDYWLALWSRLISDGSDSVGFRCVYVPYTSPEWKRIREQH